MIIASTGGMFSVFTRVTVAGKRRTKKIVIITIIIITVIAIISVNN